MRTLQLVELIHQNFFPIQPLFLLEEEESGTLRQSLEGHIEGYPDEGKN